MKHKELFSGFIRLHVLYHAAKSPIYGAWMIEELAEHGYKMSPGTLYPMLHSMHGKGYLECEKKIHDGRSKKYYSCTPLGLEALAEAKNKLKELKLEIKS
ncbi:MULTISPECIES: PadR family transcriptional regulator [Pseudoalteromonas]|uniref:PadR family transcriptional regulator n=1 Tax=Pseudoalteromonas TaxID=53246 RepID=UPI0015F62169|nr:MULTISPECIES: PadR family transcriptional regulator [unclassified Pseudoalteromonas]MBA6409803.1 helix-turn-helix transcriptional regulator [Pseudoalteromonas sp. 5Ae-yellow]MDN3392770.1 PadR family transcriptional regulator [Pseudoalteromonas sp. APC 3691]